MNTYSTKTIRGICLIILALSGSCAHDASSVPKASPGKNNATEICRGRRISKAGLNDSICRWLGVPYRYGGMNRRGMDCSGLVHTVFSENGLTLPRTTAGLRRISTNIPRSNLRFGDLLFFSIKRKKCDHVGIYLGNGKFVHASTRRGVIISSLSEEYYRRHFEEGRRIIECFGP